MFKNPVHVTIFAGLAASAPQLLCAGGGRPETRLGRGFARQPDRLLQRGLLRGACGRLTVGGNPGKTKIPWIGHGRGL